MPAPYLALLPEDVSGLFTTFHANAPDVERFLKRFMVVLLTFRLKICSLYTLITTCGAWCLWNSQAHGHS